MRRISHLLIVAGLVTGLFVGIAQGAVPGTAGSSSVTPDEALAAAQATLLARLATSPEIGDALALELANLELAGQLLALSSVTDPAERALLVAEHGIAAKQDLVGTRLDPTMEVLLAQERRNLDVTRAILGVLEDESLSRMGKAIALAQLASSHEAATALDAKSVDPSHREPSDAVAALAAAHGYALTETDHAALRALDAAPDHAEIARVVDAFRLYEASTSSPEARFLSARQALLDAARDLASSTPISHSMSATCAPIEVPPAPAIGIVAIDIAGCNTEYARDFALLVDIGGNDTYRNNAGGNGYWPAPCNETSAHPAGALVDLAGNDQYVSGRSCGVNGGGIGGSGLLIDAKGDDLYLAAGLGTNGGGHGGHGLLVDADGNDEYTATEKWATNGGGFFGTGLLIDVAGDDHYAADASGTNGGADNGTGMLVDGSGNDEYAGGSRTTNGGAYDGSGALIDAGDGMDRYVTVNGVYGKSVGKNGGAGHSGAGFLFDGGGDDFYSGGDSGANGGAWFGVGLLIDVGGDDTYLAGAFGVNGSGWALVPTSRFVRTADEAMLVVGAGFLIDLAGADNFTADRFGTNGGCYVGTSFLYDGAGDDRFTSHDGGGVNGGGGGNNTAGCAAFFMNEGGNDVYVTEYEQAPLPPREANPTQVEMLKFEGGHGANGGVGGNGGVVFLFDTAGHDVYSAHTRGVNGGASGGVALLLDAAGHDIFTGRNKGANGGSFGAGAGYLLDLGGDDAYTAGRYGTNGGGVGLLLDASGHDRYSEDGAEPVEDQTVVPKGTLGAQIDQS